MCIVTLRSFNFRFGLGLVALVCMACVTPLRADTLTIGGTINQSIEDGTGPAVNNADLNKILDGDSYIFSLIFAGSITSPGTYDITGSDVLFSVPGRGVVEDSFNSVSLTIAQFGNFAQFSVLACLTTGSACNQGNELALNFMIPFANLNDQNITGQGVPNLLPLDLLEDDGVTDIHGLVTEYSYTGVPEPSAIVFVGSGLILVVLKRHKQWSKSLKKEREKCCI